MTENINLFHGDCLEEMKNISDNSVDMILCDLPYGQTRNKWDSIIPFEELWKQYDRIIKDNGAIVLFANGMFTADLMKSNPKNWKYNIVWEKDRPSGFLNAKKMPMRSHEDICVFYKKQPTYNPQFWEGMPLHEMGTKFKTKTHENNNYNEFNSRENPSAKREGDTKKYPRSVLKYKRPHPPIHPTEKPVELLEWLIKTYTNENEIVLDNCMGSGSTGVACINTNRRFIGIELDENYFNIAKERIEEAVKKKEELLTTFDK